MIIINLSKNIIRIFTITSILSLFPMTSFANNGITIDQSFTYEDGLWKPGRVESKAFYINNNKENDISIDRLYMSLKSCEYWKTGEVLDINSKQFKELARYSTATLEHNGNVLFKDKLENLLSEDGIVLSNDIDINANSKELLNMTIDMDLEMNNDAQALNNVFTIGVAYKMDTDTPVISPKPNDKLPQTGGIINGASLVALGVVSIGTGIVLNKKSKNKGGDKHNE